MNPRNLACCLALGSALVAAAPLIAMQNHTGAARSANPAAGQRPASPRNQHAEAEGERVFSQNCARCHNAPDGFSPRITGTIVRHMRVRANLSPHDEEVLLHYFNP